MPKANWGIRSSDVDNFDRDAQYKPYDGPVPVNGVYQWQVKKLQFIAATGKQLPQLRIGLELIPRNTEEKRYQGYFTMVFAPVSDRTAFRYVPFLDAIGVSGRDFETKTIIDNEGNIKSIGRWRNDAKTMIKGELKDDQDQHGNPRKTIGWMGAADEAGDFESDDDEEYYDDDDEGGYEDGDEDWE